MALLVLPKCGFVLPDNKHDCIILDHIILPEVIDPQRELLQEYNHLGYVSLNGVKIHRIYNQNTKQQLINTNNSATMPSTSPPPPRKVAPSATAPSLLSTLSPSHLESDPLPHHRRLESRRPTARQHHSCQFTRQVRDVDLGGDSEAGGTDARAGEIGTDGAVGGDGSVGRCMS